MKCPTCGAELAESALYCHRCGTPLSENNSNEGVPSGQTSPQAAAEPSSQPPKPAETYPSSAPSPTARLAEPPAARTTEEEEKELWQGGYSGKDMYKNWTLYALITLVLLVLSIWMQTPWLSWASVILVVLMWLYGTLVLAYRKLSVAYRLTSRRFFHEKGILRRVTDRIELIDIDDLTVEQSLIDRLVGVGTIKITSSDRTHPLLELRGIKDAPEVANLMDNARLEERRRRAIHLEAV